MKYFVALSAWLFDTVFFLLCILKCFFPTSLRGFAMSEGERRRARHHHGRVMIALLSYRSCLSPFEKFSARTWEINKLSETLQKRSVCVHMRECGQGRAQKTHMHKSNKTYQLSLRHTKNAHRSVEGFKYGMSRCSPGPKWKAAYLRNRGELQLLF